MQQGGAKAETRRFAGNGKAGGTETGLEAAAQRGRTESRWQL
jgi:hypothetical protein